MLKKILIFIVAILSIIVISSMIFFGNKKPAPSTTPPVSISPTIIKQISPTKPIQQIIPLQIESTIPSGKALETIDVATPITIKFNQQVDPTTLVYTVQPKTETIIATNFDKIIIEPKDIWAYRQETTITIQSIKSTTGQILSSPFTIKIKVPVPQGE